MACLECRFDNYELEAMKMKEIIPKMGCGDFNKDEGAILLVP